MAAKTVDQFRKSGKRATMEDALILFECRPRKVQPVEYVEFEEVERKEYTPWNGRNEPQFEVETPNPWKV
jgi:hypothetical protein